MGEDGKYENWVKGMLDSEFGVETADLWIGKEGMALEVRTTQEQQEMMQQQSDVTPHITLTVVKGH